MGEVIHGQRETFKCELDLLEAVRKGEEIAITKRGTVVARLVPARKAKGSVVWPDSAARMKRVGPRDYLPEPDSAAARTLDILHVAAAVLIDARSFVTGDRRQAALAEATGLDIIRYRGRT